MRILFLGDSHGNWAPMFMMMDHARKNFDIDAVFQVGDFGFYPGAIKRLNQLREQLGFGDLPLHFIDGNHEDHVYLFEANKKKLSEKNLFYHPRGTICELGGRKIGCMGGAFNVDRPQEIFVVEKEDGFVQRVVSSFPLKEEIDPFVDRLNTLDEPVDLMVTHGCPGGIGVGVQGHPAFVPGVYDFIIDAGYTDKDYPINDVGEAPLEDLWNGMDHKPPHWVFGHYHQHHYNTVDGCKFWCIGRSDCSPVEFRFYIYDTETNEFGNIR